MRAGDLTDQLNELIKLHVSNCLGTEELRTVSEEQKMQLKKMVEELKAEVDSFLEESYLPDSL